jgi:translation initiation factor IF-2
VEYLHKKGYSVENNPNSKLTEEMMSLLYKEFAPDRKVKEEAQKIGLDAAPKQALSIDDKHVTKKEPDQEYEPELYIKGATVGLGSEAYKAAKTAKPKAKEEKPKAKEAEVKKEEVEVPAPEEIIATPEKIQATEVTEKPVAEAPQETVESVPVVPEPPAPEVVIPSPEPQIVVEAEPEAATEPGLKVLGKIDLSEFEKKPKPSKKGKGKAKTEAEAEEIPGPAAEPEVIPETPAPVEAEKTEVREIPAAEVSPEIVVEPTGETVLFKRERIVLEGVKILGKIDLPVERKAADKKKEPVASSSEDKLKEKKKKRKRIKKQLTPLEPEGGKPKEDGQKGKKTATPYRGPEKTEVSTEDIERQIKETLARIGGSGKSKASKYRKAKRELISQQMHEEAIKLDEDKKVIKATEFVTANDLAVMMNVKVTDVISTCMSLGLMVSINQRLDAETILLVADEFGYKVEFVGVEVQEAIQDLEESDAPGEAIPRAPIITVMGHVDHGKTMLLDTIRKTNVIAGEAGGITQHIGAYEVSLESGKKITFLDTPGHEAFTAMRARGAKITDVAIIVIAADDAVMPQTVEAINHAQAAGIPMVFAINKIDKYGANSEKIREQLSQMNILVEEWGGKYQAQEISAKGGLNIDLLLEKVLLEAELLELKANPNRRAYGTIIESSLDKGRGYVAKMLVQNGTLNVGDVVIAGSVFGRVKAMYNERNQAVKSAGPSTPILMLGLQAAPQAGDSFNVMADEKEAKNLATKRQQLQREQGIRTQKHITLDEIGRRIAIGDFKELNIIIKGDVDGSVEALSDSLLKLSTAEVQVNVIHKSVGPVTESDVLLASASNAIIVAFQVRPSLNARKLAEKEQIDIRLYSIIYNAINEIKSAIEGMLAPEIEEKITSNVEIREIFKISKFGTVAGCMVLDGKINRNTKIRVIRDGIVVYSGTLSTLKRFKDDVKEVYVGQDCGLSIENFHDIKVGDIIEGYEETEIKRKL